MFESFINPLDKGLKLETREEIFARKKQASLDYINDPLTADREEIDYGVLGLVVTLNKLPFLYTSSIGSCEGHAKTNHGATHAKFWPGYVAIETDDSEAAAEFMNKVEAIISKHIEARIIDRRDEEHHLLEDGDGLPNGFVVEFADKDKAYKQRMIPKEEALRLEADGKEIIKELEELARECL